MLADVSIRFVNLGIELEDLGKSISVFGIEIAYYGIVIAIGMILALMLVFHEAKRTNQNVETYYDLAICVILSGIIGARLYYVIFAWDMYKDDMLSIFNIRNGGLAIYGGILAGILAAFIYSRIKKLSFMRILDTAVLGLLVGQILGRWGNFFNREAFGGYTDNLFAMQIKLDEVGGIITDSISKNIKIVNGIEYIQVHPTFLYESIWNLVLLGIIMVYRKHKKFDGEIISIYMMGYGLGRFIIEGLRTDQLLLPGIHVAVSQVVSVCMIIIGAGFVIYKRKIQRGTKAEENKQEDSPA
ncbi:MAG: prolipoprotein diacylglyceryl transferase [Lachnospiraceae bacterium]|nr:prolipoprotein diacylglyceryl transferase [Lachnospiraceae bacterium]